MNSGIGNSDYDEGLKNIWTHYLSKFMYLEVDTSQN